MFVASGHGLIEVRMPSHAAPKNAAVRSFILIRPEPPPWAGLRAKGSGEKQLPAPPDYKILLRKMKRIRFATSQAARLGPTCLDWEVFLSDLSDLSDLCAKLPSHPGKTWPARCVHCGALHCLAGSPEACTPATIYFVKSAGSLSLSQTSWRFRHPVSFPSCRSETMTVLLTRL